MRGCGGGSGNLFFSRLTTATAEAHLAQEAKRFLVSSSPSGLDTRSSRNNKRPHRCERIKFTNVPCLLSFNSTRTRTLLRCSSRWENPRRWRTRRRHCLTPRPVLPLSSSLCIASRCAWSRLITTTRIFRRKDETGVRQLTRQLGLPLHPGTAGNCDNLAIVPHNGVRARAQGCFSPTGTEWAGQPKIYAALQGLCARRTTGPLYGRGKRAVESRRTRANRSR